MIPINVLTVINGIYRTHCMIYSTKLRHYLACFCVALISNDKLYANYMHA